jgi:hypothetical protein
MSKPNNTVARRPLHFQSLDDLLNDAQALKASGATANGGWSTGQILSHVAAVIEASVEGFTFTVPLPLRILGRLIRGRSLKKGFPSGIKIPNEASAAFVPPSDVTFEQAVDQLTSVIQKAKQRRMTQVSPIFGKLNHDQWVQLHCRHAELHFSFLAPIN